MNRTFAPRGVFSLAVTPAIALALALTAPAARAEQPGDPDGQRTSSHVSFRQGAAPRPAGPRHGVEIGLSLGGGVLLPWQSTGVIGLRIVGAQYVARQFAIAARVAFDGLLAPDSTVDVFRPRLSGGIAGELHIGPWLRSPVFDPMLSAGVTGEMVIHPGAMQGASYWLGVPLAVALLVRVTPAVTIGPYAEFQPHFPLGCNFRCMQDTYSEVTLGVTFRGAP